MLATTLMCWVAFGVVLFRFDPTQAGFAGFALFFLALFFAVWGSMSLIGVGLRVLVRRKTLPYQHVGVSLRQALWFAITLCMSLFLLTQGLFTWWITLALLIALVSFESVFLAKAVQGRYAQGTSKRTSKNRYHRVKRRA
jgi:UPF0716 family protein affecting phage T7 exclusion